MELASFSLLKIETETTTDLDLGPDRDLGPGWTLVDLDESGRRSPADYGWPAAKQRESRAEKPASGLGLVAGRLPPLTPKLVPRYGGGRWLSES